MSDQNRKTILLVDDDKDLLKLLSMRLHAAGFEVVTAESGEAAVARFVALRPDLVVSDLRMDGMDGMAVFENIRHKDPYVPVIILTAHGTIPDAVEAVQRGVFSYLTKPFDSQELLGTIDRALSLGSNNSHAHEVADGGAWRGAIISKSSVMEDVLDRARKAAGSDASVLILGESGTGKELLARAIHDASPRADGPFIAVNCSAIPEQLLESELFGHVKGAFTGATDSRKGLFLSAHGGTIFLDEIAEMPLAFQTKLLRALQEREIRPVGGVETVPIDVRIISATNKDVEDAVANGEFREDLYYRLNVVAMELPGLRERREDIPLLATHFLGQISAGNGRGHGKKVFAPEALEAMVGARWPGNVRQLRNVVEQTYILSNGPVISAADVRKALRDEDDELLSFQEARSRFERDYLVRLLEITEGNVTKAARMARRNRTEFYKLLSRHSLEPGLFRGI